MNRPSQTERSLLRSPSQQSAFAYIQQLARQSNELGGLIDLAAKASACHWIRIWRILDTAPREPSLYLALNQLLKHWPVALRVLPPRYYQTFNENCENCETEDLRANLPGLHIVRQVTPSRRGSQIRVNPWKLFLSCPQLSSARLEYAEKLEPQFIHNNWPSGLRSLCIASQNCFSQTEFRQLILDNPKLKNLEELELNEEFYQANDYEHAHFWHSLQRLKLLGKGGHIQRQQVQEILALNWPQLNSLELHATLLDLTTPQSQVNAEQPVLKHLTRRKELTFGAKDHELSAQQITNLNRIIEHLQNHGCEVKAKLPWTLSRSEPSELLPKTMSKLTLYIRNAPPNFAALNNLNSNTPITLDVLEELGSPPRLTATLQSLKSQNRLSQVQELKLSTVSNFGFFIEAAAAFVLTNLHSFEVNLNSLVDHRVLAAIFTAFSSETIHTLKLRFGPDTRLSQTAQTLLQSRDLQISKTVKNLSLWNATQLTQDLVDLVSCFPKTQLQSMSLATTPSLMARILNHGPLHALRKLELRTQLDDPQSQLILALTAKAEDKSAAKLQQLEHLGLQCPNPSENQSILELTELPSLLKIDIIDSSRFVH